MASSVGRCQARERSDRAPKAYAALSRKWRLRSFAAVQGRAVGAGFAFATAAAPRIVAANAKLSGPFLRLDMTAGDFGLSWLLPRLIGNDMPGAVASRAFALTDVSASTYLVSTPRGPIDFPRSARAG